MISEEMTPFDKKIKNILYNLSMHHRDKDTIIQDMVSERLENSLKTYTCELELLKLSLSSRDSLSMLKRISRG